MDMRGQEYDEAPRPVKMPPVEYPAQAKTDSVEGLVILTVTIDTKGTVTAVSVYQSVREDMDRAVMDAWRQSVWKPAKLKGEPVEVTVNFPVRFKLKKAEK